MIRGTTPTHTFSLPVPENEVKNARIIYKQGGEKLLTKKFEDIRFSDNEVHVDLTQKETLKFTAGSFAYAQIHVFTNNGKRFINEDPVIIEVKETFDEEILT